MWRFIVFILLLLRVESFVFAQNTFSLNFKQSNTSDGIGMIIENNKHNYIGVGARTIVESQKQTATIWIIYNDGDSLTREYHFADSSAGFLYIEQKQNGNYMLLGTIAWAPDYYMNQLVLELDTNFNIINRKIIILPGMENIFGWKIKKLNNRYYIITATAGPNSIPAGIGDPYFIKLDENFDTIQTYHNKIGGAQLADDFIFSKDSSRILLLGTSYIPLPYGISVGEMISYDTNFVYLGYKIFPNVNFSDFQARWISDSTFLLGCNLSTLPDVLYDQCFLESDTSLTIFKQTSIGIPDTNDWRASNSTYDFSTADSIFYTGIKNGVPSFWITEPSWIRIGMINRDLENIYERFYGGDAYYVPSIIFKTSDGGMLIYSTRYDLSAPEYSADVFILKLNNEGLITSTKPNQACPYLPFILYPNPGKDFLNINLVINKAMLKIIDIKGNTILTQNLFFGQNIIDCSEYNPGIYIVSLTNAQNEIFTNKWIKQN